MDPLFASVSTLTQFQFSLVDNIFSMTVATMGAAALFFFLSRSQVAAKYRPALMVSGIVVAIACYHYFMIRASWQDAYAFKDGVYAATGKDFNDFYRYADWILTVPLLMVELVAVMGLARAKASGLLTKLVIAAALMIGLGYPGEVISSAGENNSLYWLRIVWGIASTIPFLYILYVLWFELTASLENQPPQARKLLEVARLVILVTWAVYPIAYALGGHALLYPEGGGGWLTGSGLMVAEQVAYAIADITAKAAFGVLIYYIARAKTFADQESAETTEPEEVAAVTA